MIDNELPTICSQFMNRSALQTIYVKQDDLSHGAMTKTWSVISIKDNKMEAN